MCCICSNNTQEDNMKLENYKQIVAAIPGNDLVMHEARAFALELCAGGTHGFDGLLDELNGSWEDDCAALGCWDEQQEDCTDYERVEEQLGRKNLYAALEAQDNSGTAEQVLLLLVCGMIQRSATLAALR